MHASTCASANDCFDGFLPSNLAAHVGGAHSLSLHPKVSVFAGQLQRAPCFCVRKPARSLSVLWDGKKSSSRRRTAFFTILSLGQSGGAIKRSAAPMLGQEARESLG